MEEVVDYVAILLLGCLAICQLLHSVSIIDTLTQYLRADIFGNRRTVNKTILTLVAALGNISFRVHLHMVDWFSNWITEVQSWGRGQKT